MRLICFLLIVQFVYFTANAQTVDVAGLCITGTNTLERVEDINGKFAYQGTGTVDGAEGVTISVYWLPAPDSVWVIDFDGQPYVQSQCGGLAPQATGNPSCPWTPVSETTCEGATPLVVSGPDVLPVKLISFTASPKNKQVELNWKTGSEANNRGFEVQRSSDGSAWTKIGFVPGAVNSSTEKNYRFIDTDPLSGKNYYVLAQYDLDDRRSNSSIVHVDFSLEPFYRIANNPGNGIFQLTVRSADPVEIAVLDLAGQKLFSKIAAEGVHQLDISRYAAGVYILQLKKGRNVITEKLIKER